MPQGKVQDAKLRHSLPAKIPQNAENWSLCNELERVPERYANDHTLSRTEIIVLKIFKIIFTSEIRRFLTSSLTLSCSSDSQYDCSGNSGPKPATEMAQAQVNTQAIHYIILYPWEPRGMLSQHKISISPLDSKGHSGHFFFENLPPRTRCILFHCLSQDGFALLCMDSGDANRSWCLHWTLDTTQRPEETDKVRPVPCKRLDPTSLLSLCPRKALDALPEICTWALGGGDWNIPSRSASSVRDLRMISSRSALIFRWTSRASVLCKFNSCAYTCAY